LSLTARLDVASPADWQRLCVIVGSGERSLCKQFTDALITKKLATASNFAMESPSDLCLGMAGN
jgi:hypothetical protein